MHHLFWVLCHFCVPFPFLSIFFFFFNDLFADKITLVCKQLQNDTGIFNLQMGVPYMSRKAKHGTVALVFTSSLPPFFLLLSLKDRLDFRWAFTSDSSDNFVLFGLHDTSRF